MPEITRRGAITGTLLVSTSSAVATVAEPPGNVPDRFNSYKELEVWANDCFGGGFCTKFFVKWHGKQIELCYSTRTFTSGVPSAEITFWRPDQTRKDGWVKTIGTGVLKVPVKVVIAPDACILKAYEHNVGSWVDWLTIATPLLCNTLVN